MMNTSTTPMQTGRVGYAFVPDQRLGKVYMPKKALMEGTVFPELNITIAQYTRGVYDGK